jgi:hypothetical protein
MAYLLPYLHTAGSPISVPMAPAAPYAAPPLVSPPVATCTVGTVNNIYSDALQAGWDSWYDLRNSHNRMIFIDTCHRSWATVLNMSDTTRKRSGSKSISFIPQGWEAVYFARPGDTFSTSSYSGVEFYVNGAPNGGQQLRVGFRQNSNEFGYPLTVDVNSYIVGATSIGNVWRRVYVPFSAMQIAPGNTLMGITIGSVSLNQLNQILYFSLTKSIAQITDTAQARVWIDDVRLICQ